jgi:hypothetical protein
LWINVGEGSGRKPFLGFHAKVTFAGNIENSKTGIPYKQKWPQISPQPFFVAVI